MVIYPEVLVTPDCPTVKFHQPRDQVDLEKELPRILHAQGWGCGTYFNVQFLSHDKTKLLACAKFVVSEEKETLHTSDNQYNPNTKTVFTRSAAQLENWWPDRYIPIIATETIYSEPTKPIVDSVKEPTNNPSKETRVYWNPGKKVHQVKVGDTVMFESPDKDVANAEAAKLKAA